MRGIEAQFLALQKGFNELIPQHLLKPFDQKELEVSAGQPQTVRPLATLCSGLGVGRPRASELSCHTLGGVCPLGNS